jgi:hypothetical protein
MLLAVCRNKISSRARHVARYTYTLRAEQAARAPTFACQQRTDDPVSLGRYKLANEAALKAALVRNKKAKSLPRFNSTAQRVRERQQCIKQVIVEEHSKPLQARPWTHSPRAHTIAAGRMG